VKRDKKFLKKTYILPVIIILLAQLLSVFAFADTKQFVNWTLSLDGEVIEGNGKMYTKYGYTDVMLDADDVYQYANGISPSSGEAYRVYAPANDTEFIWIVRSDELEIYATDKGRTELDSFIGGEGGIFRIVGDAHQKSAIDKSCVESMRGATSTLDIDVRELRAVDSYEIYAYDATDTLAYKYGAVFFYGDELLFVRYSELSNNCFDADGNFSFRSGTVTMKILDGESTSQIKLAGENMSYRSTAHHYENFSDATPDIPKAFFWMCCLAVGFVLPLPMLGLGLLMPRLKFLSRPRAWYWLAVLAALWIVLSAVLMVLLLI